MDLPSDKAEVGRALGERREERDAFAFLAGDASSAAALAVEQAFYFEVAHRAGDGGAGGGECFGEFGLGGQAIAGLESAGGDVAEQRFEDVAMARLSSVDGFAGFVGGECGCGEPGHGAFGTGREKTLAD